jgi:transposase-like protein
MNKTNISPVSQITQELSSIDLQKILLNRAKDAVLSTALHLLEMDMELLCGSRFSRKDGGLCHRGGSELTSLLVDGGKHPIKKPRARNGNQEVELPTLKKLQDRELLDRQMYSRMMLGVSSRNYEEVIGGLAKKTGIKRSSVSRAFIRASVKDLDSINSADLSMHRFVGILIDGTNLGGRTVVVAVGLTAEKEKIPVGLKEGDTENAQVVKDLLASLVARKFTFAAGSILAVLDGGKALRSGVKALWGDNVIIQRCWLHKLENLKDYLPKTYHGQIRWRMKKMMGINSFSEAKSEMDSIQGWLATISSEAESSLLEAGEELLTVHKLGIVGTFRKVLTTTNIIESVMGATKDKTRKVKNWGYHPKTGDKVKRNKILRWVASAICSHKQKMKKINGTNGQFATLIQSLNNIAIKKKAA